MKELQFVCKRCEELLWEWKETAASPFLWLWGQVGADLLWHHEKSNWVSVAEMPFVDALHCWTLWPPAPRTSRDMVIHPCQGHSGWAPPFGCPSSSCCQISSATLFWCWAICAARAWKQWSWRTLFLHLPCTKRNVKQCYKQIEMHKGTLFSAIFLHDFQMTEECFLLFGIGCCGSVHAMSKGICQGHHQLQPLTKISFMTLEKGMG